MYKLIRFYNQNRKKIFKIILIIVFIFAIIQLLNYFSKISKENVDMKNVNIVNNFNNTHQELVSNKSVITGERVSENKLKSDLDIINKFMEYCNEGSIEKAYNLLSDDCKEVLFETKEDFKDNYYDSIFNKETKLYTVENWTSNTYKVNISNNILATGKITNNFMDYFTVVKENDEYKLNIKNYIGKENINKETENNNIKIKILKKDIYMDYEIYDIQIMNNSDDNILLDTKRNTKTVYLQDSKNVKYYAYTNEVIDNDFIVRKGKMKNIRIKFSSGFSSNRKIEYMIFSDLVLNFNEYEDYENKEDYTDIYKLNVNF